VRGNDERKQASTFLRILGNESSRRKEFIKKACLANLLCKLEKPAKITSFLIIFGNLDNFSAYHWSTFNRFIKGLTNFVIVANLLVKK